MKFRALIVDSNPQSRNLLWEAVLAESSFLKVAATKSLEEARVYLESGSPVDVILFSSSTDQDKQPQFIAAARKLECSKEAAIVSVVRVVDQEPEKMALSLITGTDGFLLSPYSVSSVRQVAEIAERVKRKHEERRIEAGLRMMLMELVKVYDEVEKLTLLDRSTEKLKQKLEKSMAKATGKWTGEKDRLLTLIRDSFKMAAPNPPPRYKGASKRLAKKML